MQGSRIFTGPREGLRALGIGGQTVVMAYQQIEHDLRRHLSVEHAALFAEPNISAAAVDWFAATQSDEPARSLTELSAVERAPVVALLGRLVEGIRRRATSLQTSNREGERLLGQMLELALEIPSRAYILVIDGHRPVLTFWGHTSDRDLPERDVLSRLLAEAAPPLPPPPLLPPDPSAAPLQAAGSGAGQSVETIVAPVHVERVILQERRRDWRVWLAGAGLLLTLCVIGFLLLRACGLGLGSDLTLVDYCSATETLPALTLAQQRQVALEQELAELTRRAALEQQRCAITTAPVHAPPVTPPDTPPISKPVAPPVQPVQKPEEIKLPTDKKDITFLNGCWKSISDVYVAHKEPNGTWVADKDKPIEDRYCFDENGEGTVHVGGSVDCDGHVHAERLPDGGLRISPKGGLSCRGDGINGDDTVECKQDGATAKCRGTPNKSDAPPYNITIQRQQ